MGILLGPFDPLQLIFNTLNTLMKRGLLSYEEAREILKQSMDPKMSEDQKENILNSLVRKTEKK
jgi:hypothetical protein